MALKNLSMLAWFSQLGISAAVPPVICIWLAVWLKNRFCLGTWVIWVGILLGVYCSAAALISSLRAMERLSRRKKQDPPPACNDHL